MLGRSLDPCVIQASHISPLKTEIQGVMGEKGGHEDRLPSLKRRRGQRASMSFLFPICKWVMK